MFWIEKFGSVIMPKWSPNHFVGTGSASNFTVLPLPGGGVYDSLGAAQARTQGLQIRVQAAIAILGQSEAALETQERALRGMTGKRDKLWRIWDSSGAEEWCWARCISVGDVRTEENKKIAYLDIPILFQMESSVWYGETQLDILDAEPLGDMLLTGVDELDVYPVIYSIFNNGNVPQSEVTFKITAKGGAVTAVSITNSISGHVLSWAGTLAANKTLVIDCGKQSAKNDGTDCYDDMTLSTTKDEWMLLEPGENPISIQITEAGTQSTIEILAYDSHL